MDYKYYAQLDKNNVVINSITWDVDGPPITNSEIEYSFKEYSIELSIIIYI
jgi:hypothetical protein